MEDLPQPQPKPQALHDIATDVDGRRSRIMAKFRDSLLSKLAVSNPSISINSDHGSLIDRQVQEIFKSFHTPTHPPYALMIQRAITELSEEIGSSEEAISDFIRKEYKDLPWAHVRILGVHLRKLCVHGELVCTETGRYKLLTNDGNFGSAKEMPRKENKKQKRGTKTKNHRDIEESMKMERSEGVNRENGLGKENEDQIQVFELQVNGNNEPSRMLEKRDEQITEQSGAHLQSIEISKEQSNSGKGLLGKTEQQIQSQLQGIEVTEERDEAEGSHEKVAEMDNVAERLQIGSIEGRIQENNVDLNRQSKEKAEGYLLTEKCVQDGKEHQLAEEEQNGVNDALNESLGQQTKVVPQQNMEQLQTQDQAESLVSSPHPEPMEAIYSSQPTALDLPANLSPSSRCRLAVPILEESPYCIPSTGKELLPTKVQLQVSGNGPSETDLGATSKMSASLSFMNVNEHKQPQIWNQGSTTPKLEENLTIGVPEQRPLKRRRGRLTEPKPTAGFLGELLPPLDAGILDAQPQGQGTGQWRPPKLAQNAPQLEKQLQPQSQAQSLDCFQNLEPDVNRSQEHNKLQLDMQNSVPKVSNCGPDMPPIANTSAEQRQWQQSQTFEGQGWTWEIDPGQQSQTSNGQGLTWEIDPGSGSGQGQGRSRGRGRGRGRPRVRPQGWTWEIDPGSSSGNDSGRGRGRGR